MKRILTGALAFALFAACTTRDANAVLVVGYDAVDTSAALAAINGGGVTGSTLSTVGLTNQSGGGSDWAWSGWPTGGPNSTDAFVWSLTSTTAYNLTTVELRGVRSDVGPINLELQIDSGSGFVSFGTLGVGTVASTLTYNTAIANVTSAAFRLLGSSAGNSGSNATFSLVDAGNLNGTADLVVNGNASTVGVVPEASSLVFGSLLSGIVGLVAIKKRKARVTA